MTQPAGAGAPVALIVDDDLTMRLLIRQALERAGFVCHEAEQGAAALERFPQLQPDIVLLDVVMPHMDGYAACAALRGMPAGAFVPVLMLTGLDDVESIDRAYEVGATDFISKPINWGILGHRARYILRASQAFRELAKNRAGLESAQRIARLGSWEWDLQRDRVHWSDETYRILGLVADREPAPAEMKKASIVLAFLCLHNSRRGLQAGVAGAAATRPVTGILCRRRFPRQSPACPATPRAPWARCASGPLTLNLSSRRAERLAYAAMPPMLPCVQPVCLLRRSLDDPAVRPMPSGHCHHGGSRT